MEYMISNLENSLKADLPLLSLAGGFILIDAVAAVNTKEGIASGKVFKEWMQTYLPQYLDKNVSAEDYYKFRCALLHQLSGSHADTAYSTLLFFPKNSCISGHRNHLSAAGKKAYNLDIAAFIKDVISAARKCLNQSEHYKTHKQTIITLHQDGLDPFVKGTPVIASGLPAKTLEKKKSKKKKGSGKR